MGLGIGILIALKVPMQRAPQTLVSGEIFLDTDLNKVISIHNLKEATEKRAELTNFIWGPNGLPKERPAKVEPGIQDDRYAHLSNLKQIDRLTINMEWGLTSTVYHFIPEQGNNKILIYHGGHDGDVIIAKDLIAFFLKNGFSVMAFSMPLETPNNRPVVDLEGIGKIQLSFHEQLKLLKMKAGHPVQLFLTPVTVALNQVEPLGYTAVYMTGVSGGGWTTTMYAAVDPRITRSYPVAGTLPLHLRGDEGRSNTAQRAADWGDYEQTIPELNSLASYLDLYILGSFGEHRKQLQIMNKRDPCCFAGELSRTYEGVVNDRVRALGGGTFAVYLDTKNQAHSISSDAFTMMLADINAER